MQFRECFGYSREEFEEILAKHNREKEAEFMEGDVFGGLLMETVSAPLVAIEGIQNQWRARTGRKTDYSFLEGRDQTRSEVTAGMGSIGTALYLGAADITSQLTLGVMTLGQDKVLAGAMGIMYMDAMQHRKEREGVDELKVADTALLTGMADYCLGRLGYGSISRCVEEGVRKSLVRKMGESFLTGAGMALGSEIGGQLIDWMLNGRLSEWGKIYNAHLDEGMSETEAFGEMVKAVGPELTVHTVAGGISGAGFAVIHMLAASKDNRLRKQETIEKTNQEGERNRNESGSASYGAYSTKIDSKVTVVEKHELPSWLIETYKDGQYRTVVTNEEITVYRVFGYNAEAGGAFATSNPAINRVQTKVDSAILPEWKNSLKYEAEIVIPKGTTLNIGRVGEQYTMSGARLAGDADQFLLPQNWDLNWIKSIRTIKP